MGQPIKLLRDGEQVTVYGPNQASVMVAQGWQPANEAAASPVAGVADLTAIKGVGAAVAAILAEAGYRTYISIADAPSEDLVKLDKISPRTVKSIQAEAAKLLV